MVMGAKAAMSDHSFTVSLSDGTCKEIGPNTIVCVCGSNAMIADAKKLMLERGLNEKNFYSDAFLASEG